jgi:hypothetical protein
MEITSQKIASGQLHLNKLKIKGDIKMSNNDWAKYIQVNCRTCAHITPLSDSTWHCERWDAIVPLDAQLTGCESHVIHPDLVPWKRIEGLDWVAIYEIDGQGIANGEPGEGVYGSKELLANAAACVAADPQVMGLRKEWDGRVVG